jgi:hypothetical protein
VQPCGAAARRVVVARLSSVPALESQDRRHEQQQHQREPRGRGRISHRHPGAVDPGGERLDAEIRHRAEVGERLHQRERHASGNRRPRERQRDVEERSEAAASQQASRLDEIGRLLEESGAREQVDVGIEHQREHQHRAAQRADLGKPVFASAPAGELAQGALHDTRKLQEVRVRVRDHVCGHRERQDQRPFHHRAAWKTIEGNQPRRAHAEHHYAHGDAAQQRQGRRDVVREHRIHQVNPGVLSRHEGAHRDCRERSSQQQRHTDGSRLKPGDLQRDARGGARENGAHRAT